MSTEQFRVVPSPFYRPVHLALARRYSDLNEGIAAMGGGMVVSADGSRLVAFHERHLALLKRLAAPRVAP